jgi:cephalosporin hydroxylase
MKAKLTEEVATTIINNFYALLYSGGVWQRTYWRGHPATKLPSDLFVYQELIHAVRPDYIVETGTAHGGSALFFADMLELEGQGEVITIDLNFRPDRPDHHRIKYINADSLDAFAEIESVVRGKKVIVSLDSDHQKDHVLAEMELYAPLATEYLVVEDTSINHPIAVEGIDEGPMEAVTEFLETHKEFEIDRTAHKFLVTTNPNGWLRRRIHGRETPKGQADWVPRL